MGNTPYGYTNTFKPCLKILKMGDPENHRFQCSNGLYNDFDDLGVVREPPHSHPHAWTASCALPLTSSGWQPQTSAAAIKNSLSSAVISLFKQIMKHNCHLRIILSNHLLSSPRLNTLRYSNMAGWKIPELKGGFCSIIELNGTFSNGHVYYQMVIKH